jgi:magnesium chelatase family protein
MEAVEYAYREGTSMLARRLTTLMPAMPLAEALDTTCIHRIAGRTSACAAAVTGCSLRAPHHTTSDVGIICRGHVAVPGDGSLNHRGVLCPDERPACTRHVLGGRARQRSSSSRGSCGGRIR